jgi:hypothetical protein
MKEYTFEEINSIVTTAYEKVCTKDTDLLFIGANERSLTHRMAVYLEPSFPEWNVDCEYNRADRLPKRLHYLGGTHSKDGDRIFPDIIVHKRQGDKNLLVIEAKTTENNELHKEGSCLCDRCKLEAYVNELGYQYAFSLIFPIKGNKTGSGIYPLRNHDRD